MLCAAEGDERCVLPLTASVLYDHHGFGSNLVHNCPALVDQFRSNESELAEKVCELVGESPLTARGLRDDAEQTAHIICHLHSHFQACQVAGGAQHNAQRLTAFVNIHGGFCRRHHCVFRRLEGGCAPIERCSRLRISDDDVENLPATRPTCRGLQSFCRNLNEGFTSDQVFHCAM